MSDYPLHQMLEQVREVVGSGASVRTGFFRLLDYCEATWPDRVWKMMRGLEIEADVAGLRRWTRHVLTTEPPSIKIKAFWFGLFNPIKASGLTTCAMYISGSTQFDARDGDWAAWATDSYWPRGRVADSGILDQVYSLLRHAGLVTEGEYVLCLGYAALAIKEIMEDWTLPTAVGFDSGDYVLLRG